MRPPALLQLGALALAPACQREAPDPDAGRPAAARGFPRAQRGWARPEHAASAAEARRDAQGEARTVMDLARIAPGMTVADIGAGAGYYTVRLSPRVGRKGRVLAQDIDPGIIAALGDRVARERLDNVSIQLGEAADPRLPAGSFDRAFLVHVYSEVTEPYALLWRLRPALKPGGQVVVVDADRPTAQHGMPPAQLFCEFAAVGFRLAEFARKPETGGYFARFAPVGAAPAPAAIRACPEQVKANARR